MICSIHTMWQFSELFPMFLPMTSHKLTSKIPEYGSTCFSFVQAYGMVDEACSPSNAYYPQTPDNILYSVVHVCWTEHSDSSFVYGFMSLIMAWVP